MSEIDNDVDNTGSVNKDVDDSVNDDDGVDYVFMMVSC